MSIAFEKSFESFDGVTSSGKKKVECWSDRNPLKPYEVTKRCGKKCWFECDKCGHEFESVLSSITKNNGSWCPYCANRSVCGNISCEDCFKKSFASFDGTVLGKKKVDYWSDRNELKPINLSNKSNKKIWFDCDKCGHEFESVLSSITKNNGSWCPYCANKKICSEDILCYHCFNNSFASFDGVTVLGKKKVDYWSDRNELKPREVTKGSEKKIWFDCDKCGHEFESSPYSITKNNRWCPYCANQKLCNNISCEDCFNKSFASFDGLTSSGNLKTDCWSDRNELKPHEVTKGSEKKIWFDCDKCGHEFESSPYSITKNNRWCPYCANQKRCNIISCEHCFNNSFASFDGVTVLGKKKADCWSDRNELKPHEVTKSSHKKFWFECDHCGHEFITSIADVSREDNRNTWCPYCSNPCKKLCSEDTLCYHCYNKSFASVNSLTPSGNLKTDCWSDRNPLNPREICKSSGKIVWFDCDQCGHDFKSVLYHITKGSWCPNCQNKTELKLYNWLLEKDYVNSVEREWCPKWCSTEYTHFVKTKYKIGRYHYRFDFLVTLKNEKQIIIELDGRQHYEQVKDWKTPIEQQIRDKYKEFKAKKNGLSIIRCYQEDVYMDRNEWEHTLCNLLSSLL